MDETTNALLEAISNEYIGDDLTMEDLQSAYVIFMEEEKNEQHSDKKEPVMA